MKRLSLVLVLLVATTAHAQVNVARVADDALVIDRVAEASKRDLPTDLLRRIVTEDIELLRGARADGTYQYATWERLEAKRETVAFTIQPKGEKSETVEARGSFLYRVILDSPGRRLLVAKNRPLFIERVVIDYIPAGGTKTKVHAVDVNAQLVPGQNRPIELPEIARHATVRVTARADKASGYGNLNVTTVQARIVDRSDSPYADAVASAKAILRALDNNDIPSMRAMASRMRTSLGTSRTAVAPSRTIEVVAAAPAPSADAVELHAELQVIEDLLTGSESERREGLDKLHQLLRRLRPR
jgi:hypothetical protein